jgi:gamma-glutamyltranspeptidase/glutathione hydrolase
MVTFSKKTGGYFCQEDLESFEPIWVEPLSVNYRGFDVWELPPNGQGIIVLMALNILKGFEMRCKEDPESYHKQIEALKLAFSDGLKYITDIGHMKVSVESLLSEEYANLRRDLIGEYALLPQAGDPYSGGTVYFATADKDGNMVSYIQSNYMGFGSGIVVPNTGISLQNRGTSFSLNEEDHNCLKPLKRPYHTIIPGFITKENKAIGPFGVMGGYMQPQGHLQFLNNFIDFHLNPQAALDAPRWQWVKGKEIMVEKEFPKHILESLIDKGHQIEVSLNSSNFGRGQFIYRSDDGVLIGGTEPRADSNISCF